MYPTSSTVAAIVASTTTSDSGVDWSWLTWPFFIGLTISLVHAVIRLTALGVIPENRRPSSGMAWVLVILLNPTIGFIVWLFLGRTTLGSQREERQKQADENLREVASRQPEPELPDDVPAYLSSALRLSQGLGGFPAVGSDTISFYPTLPGAVEAMAADVDRAQRWVHMEFYIMAWDEQTAPLFEAMARAVGRGVSVKVLFDHLGTRGLPVYDELKTRLDAADIPWRPMLPLQPIRGFGRRPDLRNHRKLLVVDGEVAFMGSHNMTQPSYNKPKNEQAGRSWVDVSCRVTGRLAMGLDAVFGTDWFTETGEAAHTEGLSTPVPLSGGTELPLVGQLVPSGPGIVSENNLRVFTTLIYGAKRRVSLTSPYFVPDESMLYAVTTAALKGIDVELFVCAEGDQFMVHHAQRSYYQALLEAGVRIYLYPAPLVLHAKHFSIDDDVMMIGSSNMDMRSFGLNYEISLILHGREAVEGIRVIEDTYRDLSTELTLEQWQDRPWRQRYLDNVMRLTSAVQ
ncbi:MAG: phospholipase D-like domain-containing protein [Ornithinimicrobium sp.]